MESATFGTSRSGRARRVPRSSAAVAGVMSIVAVVATLIGPGVSPGQARPGASTGLQSTRSDPLPPPGVRCSGLFTDLPTTNPFIQEVCWLVDSGGIDGFGDDTFRPTAALTRAGLAHALHVLSGNPSGPFTSPGFADVPADHPDALAIAWLASTGAVTGFTDGTFRPEAPVSRQAGAAVLWRLHGSPPTNVGPFSSIDVPADHPFAPAIGWMVHQGLSGHFPDGTFRPRAALSRQAGAAVLYRRALMVLVDPSTAHRCEFLDPTRCIAIYPSDHLTRTDATTDTGLRLALDAASMPMNKEGVAIDPTGLNRNDGFSPGQQIVVRFPGIDVAKSKLPSLSDLGASVASDSPIVLLDADTGQRHPFWAELDRPDLAIAPSERALMVLPATNLTEGHRYVVAFRNLSDTAGKAITANQVFSSYRDGVTTPLPWLESRRSHMNRLFDDLVAAGVSRQDLVLAFDFTVASERNLSEQLLHLRDDAFAQLGPAAPTFSVTAVEEPDVEADPDIARRVEGTVEVPLYLTGDGAPGNGFNRGPDGLPVRNGVYTAHWSCRVPRTASAADPARLSLYGHGLLGDRGEVNASNVRDFASEHNVVFCATDWIGMAEQDVPNVVAILKDFSGFHSLADRVQQGILNTLFLGRLMKHPNGLASIAAFQDGGSPLIDTSSLFYDGNSQGGIIGGAATAVAQDWTRAVLGVPGMNYSTLLKRSADWPQFALVMGTWYPSRFDQTLILAAGQAQWDRAEANGYAHHMTDDPYPGTPPHQVLLHVAFADHQVSMFAAEVEARTIGARLYSPALADGRHPAAVPLWGLDTIPTGAPYTGSAIVYWDSGTPAPPLTNKAPTGGDDPHEHPRRQATARQQKSAFFDGTFVDVCGAAPCTAS